MQKLVTLISLLLLTFATSLYANAAKKCADFRTQAQAQSHYKKLKRANKTGWKSLDRNKDGVACECLKNKSCSKGKSKAKSKKKSSLFGSKKATNKTNKKKKDTTKKKTTSYKKKLKSKKNSSNK